MDIWKHRIVFTTGLELVFYSQHSQHLIFDEAIQDFSCLSREGKVSIIQVVTANVLYLTKERTDDYD